jgi:hypothetical protein
MRRRRPELDRAADALPAMNYVFVSGLGLDMTEEWMHQNAFDIMDGFDELPRRVRDMINYAPTPEDGARATFQIVADLVRKTRRWQSSGR